MTEKNDLFLIRDAVKEDYNFVFSTFLRGLYYGDPSFTRVDKALFMKHYHDVIETLLNHVDTVVKVAALKEDPEVILGYSILSHTRLEWVFVKKAWRQIGVAKSLIPDYILTTSHLTEIGEVILKKHPSIIFDPFNLL